MIHRLLADFVVVIHFAFILFVLFGAFLAFRWRWMPWLHLPAALWGAAIELGGWFCPLTPLKNWLRQAAGTAGYSGGFVEHHLLPLVYPGRLTRPVQVALGLVVIIVNLAAYALVWRQVVRRR